LAAAHSAFHLIVVLITNVAASFYWTPGLDVRKFSILNYAALAGSLAAIFLITYFAGESQERENAGGLRQADTNKV